MRKTTAECHVPLPIHLKTSHLCIQENKFSSRLLTLALLSFTVSLNISVMSKATCSVPHLTNAKTTLPVSCLLVGKPDTTTT